MLKSLRSNPSYDTNPSMERSILSRMPGNALGVLSLLPV